MDIHSFPCRQINNVSEEDILDVFRLIWLDQNCGNDHLDILQTKILLKQIDNKCYFYNDIYKYRDDLEKKNLFQKKSLLIISGLFVETLLNDSSINQPLSLIIFCKDYDKYKEYLNKSYVIDICTDHNLLKASIERFGPSLKGSLFANHRLNTIISLRTTSYNNTNALYSYLLFIEILKQSSNMDQAKDSMIKQINYFHCNNENYLSSIKTFNETYKSVDAIEWYTKDTFLYPLINKAFRTEDSAVWYTFRFYINDLCKQIQNAHQKLNKKERFRVYRGQHNVPKQELDNIITNRGGLISSNGFFSTSKSFIIAEAFCGIRKHEENFCSVIFDITVDANELKHTVFVDIDEYLHRTSDEEEILFNIGTVFQIDDCEKVEKEGFWRIHMHATDECIEDIQHRMEPIKNKLSTININLFLGKLLIDMHHYDKAESYFNMILRNLPEYYHPDQPFIYEYLGDLQMRVKNFNNALEYFQKSYELKQNLYSKDDQNMFMTYNHLGNYYKAIGDLKTAEIYYNKTFNYKNNPINFAITKLNLSTIFVFKKKYSKARQMCLDVQEIFKQLQPIPHADIMACQGILGDIYLKQEQYDIAQDFYLDAFQMGKTYLSIGDPRLIHCICALADLYYKQGKQTLAMDFCKEQLSIHEKYLSNTNHICIARILLKMGDLSNDISYYRKAMEIFNNNMRFDYLSTAKCLMKLAELDPNDESEISRALEIYRIIYPPGHSILIETEKELMKLRKIKRTRQCRVEQNRIEQISLIDDQIYQTEKVE